MSSVTERDRASPDQAASLSRSDWSKILVEAVSRPGMISRAYTAFWTYSTGNQLLAMFQCLARGIELGPIHTFAGWLKLGRHVRKGERAIEMCMPIRIRRAEREPSNGPLPADGVDREQTERVKFVYRRHWFLLSQTDGEPYVPLAIPTWDERQACHVLVIDREPFRHMDGNCQGYACERRFAVSPIAYLPHRTMFHEIGHIVLNHTAEVMGLSDTGERTPKDVREVEAEAVSLICCQSLGLPGDVESRGYLQHWLGKNTIDDRTAQRIFHAADVILKAGRPASPDAPPGDEAEIHSA